MKKLLFILVALAFVVSSCNKVGKSLVGEEPTLRNVVLEEFTGTNCGWCPDGHKIGKELQDANPGRVVLINIHSGPYAAQYTTPFGEAIDQFCGSGGYPKGSVNREVFDGNAFSMSRSLWANAAGTIMAATSPVNIGVESVYDEGTGQLTITVELYYTADEAGGNDLNVCITENHVEGPQSGKDKNPDYVLPNGMYDHMHMFRDLVTGQWGELINETTTGSKVTREYTYTPDPTWDIENLDVNVFVTKADHATIHTGVTIPAKNGTTAVE